MEQVAQLIYHKMFSERSGQHKHEKKSFHLDRSVLTVLYLDYFHVYASMSSRVYFAAVECGLFALWPRS